MNPLQQFLNLPSSPEQLLQELSLPQVELALQTVEQSLVWYETEDENEEHGVLELDPRLVPSSLKHLQPAQWRVLAYLLQSLWIEREHSPVH